MSDPVPNVCAGPFGGLYSFYIERPWLMQRIGRAVWGIDSSVLYAAMEPIGRAQPGAAIFDVPCGGGVAFRALRPGQDVRYVAADLDPKMLRRAERRARKLSLSNVEFRAADMTSLPFGDGEADLFLSYSGLHMVEDPEAAVREISRCLKPGGQLIGTTFLAGESPRADRLFDLGTRSGHPLPPRREDLLGWLESAGLAEAALGPEPGFAAFSARRRRQGPSPPRRVARLSR